MPKTTKNSRLIYGIIGLLIVGVIGAALIAGTDESKPKDKTDDKIANTVCGAYRKDGVVTMNTHQINVEIAYDTKAKEKGLAGRPCIPSNWGMLFDFGRSGQYAFWMKGMKFPIDIIWISSSHNIVTLEENFSPSTYYSKNPYVENDPQHLARYVLEIKAGQSKALSLDTGTPVHFQQAY